VFEKLDITPDLKDEFLDLTERAEIILSDSEQSTQKLNQFGDILKLLFASEIEVSELSQFYKVQFLSFDFSLIVFSGAHRKRTEKKLENQDQNSTRK